MKKLIYMTIGFTILCSGGCGTRVAQPKDRFMTETLYKLRGSGLTIAHPSGNGISPTSQEMITLSENVTYARQEDDSASKPEQPGTALLDTNRVYNLSQVTVTSKARFTPVRQGSIELDFAIRIAKEYLSDNFCITLTPQLVYRDSVVNLPEVLLRGKEFINMQQHHYKQYEEYLASIVDSAQYPNAFVDHQGIENEIERRRSESLDKYQNEWALAKEYLDWREQTEENFQQYNDQMLQLERKKLTDAHTKYLIVYRRKMAAGEDTTAIWKKYQKQRIAIRKATPVKKVVTLSVVPAKYQKLYMAKIKPEDLLAGLPNQNDSLGLVNNFLMVDEIEANKKRLERKEEVFQRMVPFPYREDAFYSTTIVPEYNFNYRYVYTRTVSAGEKNFRLTLQGQVVATDRSAYKFEATDTLTYVIASLDELANSGLMDNPDLTDNQRSDYRRAMKLLSQRKYADALHILNEFKDYNTALTLTCLGYNQQGYDLITQLPETARGAYLAAILARRLEKKEQAARYLSRAFTIDPELKLRAPKDPEIAMLMREYIFNE